MHTTTRTAQSAVAGAFLCAAALLPAQPAAAREVFGDAQYLYLVSLSDDTPYAADFIGGQPNGDVHDADPVRGSGFRVTAGMRSETEAEVSLRYSLFDNDSVDRVSAPSGGTLATTRLHPDSQTAAATGAGVESDLDLHVLDLEIGKRLPLGETLFWRPFLGARLAWLDQELDTDYAVAAGPRTAVDSLSITAGGLRVGTDVGWDLMEGLAVEAGVSASLLAAGVEVRHVDSGVGVSPLTAKREVLRGIPVIDGYAGLRWTHGPFFVGAGAETTTWIDKGSYITFADDIADGQQGDGSDSLFLVGGYARVGMAFTW